MAEKTKVPRDEWRLSAAEMVPNPGWMEYQWQWRAVAKAYVLLWALWEGGGLLGRAETGIMRTGMLTRVVAWCGVDWAGGSMV